MGRANCIDLVSQSDGENLHPAHFHCAIAMTEAEWREKDNAQIPFVLFQFQTFVLIKMITMRERRTKEPPYLLTRSFCADFEF